MDSLLSKVRPADIIEEPFPHIVIENALDEAVYRELAAAFPGLDVFTGGADPGDNKRFNYMAQDIFADAQVAAIWKTFCRVHTSAVFLRQFIDLFGAHIRALNPTLEERLGRPLEQIRPGLRHIDTFHDADVMLDATLVVNTPVQQRPSSVRGAHVDKLHKLYTGLLYMRLPEDDSEGGDLELYRFKENSPAGFKTMAEMVRVGQRVDIHPENVEAVATVRYAPNVLVLFPNSINALHGVTPRSVTRYPRRLCTLVGDLQENQFTVHQYYQATL